MRTAGANYFNFGLRLTLTFVALIVLILGGNALVVWQFHITRNQTDRLTGANEQLIEVLRLQASLLSFHRRLDDLALSMDVRRLETEAESLRRALRERTQQTRAAIANLPSGTVVDPSFLPTLDAIDVTLPSELEAILELAKSGEWAIIHPRLGNELNPIETETAILVNSINQQASGELARSVAELRNVQRRILVIVPATAFSSFFIAAFLGWSIARRIIELRLEGRVSERTRIARELHDTLLQSLHGLLLQFQAARNMLPRRPEEGMHALDDAIDATAQTIAESRDAIQDIRVEPGSQGDLAELLKAASQELVNAQDANHRAPVFRLIVEGERQALPAVLQGEVYRIAREILRNAFQHAQANRIEAEIRYDDHALRLRIRDDGRGINSKLLKDGGRSGHWGLRGVRERAQQIGAKLDFWSEGGAGTEVQLTVPAAVAYEQTRRGSSRGRTRLRAFARGRKS